MDCGSSGVEKQLVEMVLTGKKSAYGSWQIRKFMLLIQSAFAGVQWVESDSAAFTM